MRWKLFYDGECNLCYSSQLRVGQWAHRADVPLDILTLQSEEAKSKGYGTTMVLETGEGVFYGFEAWLKVFQLAPMPLRLMQWLGKSRPTKALARGFYWVIASLRYRLFGRRSCTLPHVRNS